MQNEIIFFLQTIAVAASVLGALALGREALVACISFLFVLANLFVVKQVSLFGFDVMAADTYIIGAVLGFNLLQEFFGVQIAKKTIWVSFFISFIFVIMSQIHLWYAPNIYDSTQHLYAGILGFLPRIVLASFVAHIVSQYVRLWLYDVFKRTVGGFNPLSANKYLVGRNLVVTAIEQSVDTLLFGFIGLYGVIHSIAEMFILSFTVKILTILCITPWVVLAKRIVGRRV
jgi:hypothetical protein